LPPHPLAVDVGGYRLGGGGNLFLILGPCVIESEEITLQVAHEVARVTRSTGLPTIFKASFDKANRTSLDSFRGPGLESGLEILARVREQTGLPILSDVHSVEQAEVAGKILDVIQIPAFLCRQTDLLLAAAATGKALNIKKGQFLSPDDMANVVRKVLSSGNNRILLTERGSTFGYQDLVVDMRSKVRMKRLGFPVIIDATHSAQFPGREGGSSGGDRSLVPHIARSAVAAGADGVFMEVHPDPDHALCDGPNSLHLADLEPLATNLAAIYALVPRPVEAVRPSQAGPREAKIDRDSLTERLKKIRLIIFDVDGALTDGRIIFGSGGLEIKSFDVRDGHGIKIAKRFGIELAFVTGRTSDVAARRAEDLGVSRVYQGIFDKRQVLAKLLEELGLQPDQVAALGDDVVDIPLLRRVGVGFAVPEAPIEVRRAAHFVTRCQGGRGAAREVVEMILRAQGRWDEALGKYYL
jgi:2-dehydro-3-deoxyphosphooctonate aldolase (KDO 8-P synthase)